MIDLDRLAAAFQERAKQLLSELSREVSTSCSPDPPGGRLFLAEANARVGAVDVRMIFGDRELEIRTSVKPEGRPWPLELAFYLRAMKLDDSSLSDSMWIHDEDRMDRVLSRQTDALRICLNELEGDARRWWSLAEEQRQLAISSGREQLHREEMNVAVSRAAEAFRAGNFERVVSLLSPYSDILSDAQNRKLELARARVGSEPSQGRR